MLQINVSQQLKDPIGSVRNYEVNDVIDITGAGVSSLNVAVLYRGRPINKHDLIQFIITYNAVTDIYRSIA